MLLAATLIAIAYNFYLADKSEYLEIKEHHNNMPELLFAVLCIIALIAFAFYWGFRPNDKVPRSNPNNPDVVYTKYTNEVTGVSDNDYEIVDLHKIYGGSVPAGAYTSNPMPSSRNTPVNPNNNTLA